MEHTIPSDILDDLSSRFIINVPEEERKDLVRICFQIELAHWFYLDFYCTEENPKLKPCNMKDFATHIFQHIPFLIPHVPHIDAVLEQWREYKQNVPTFGAIVLNENMTKVLLVQSYWARNSWSFPKGKVNEDEEPLHCAVREVLEETGFDISNLIDKNEYIESAINDQVVRLYIISGVQQDTKFQPKTRKEIKNVEWFDVADLPNNKKDMTPKVKIGVGPNAFFMVVPFVKRIKRWIQEKQQRERNVTTTRRHRHKSLGDVETVPKSKRQQQLFPHSVQNEIPDFKEFKNSRQSNTSPARNRRGVHDNKNTPSKAALKRNLFGDHDEDQSPLVLAKQLIDSPQQQQPCTFLNDPAIQSIKCTDFSYKMQSSEKEVKGPRKKSLPEGNIKPLLFGDAARKLQKDFKTIPPPPFDLEHNCSPFITKNVDVQGYPAEIRSKTWDNFKFNRAILDCLYDHTTTEEAHVKMINIRH
ncbi:m7GpppN-mRNA hydrolase isoform X1 [Odontomachus brunneus]|uniref:m7GpppN-mRNA hydrolase isoform X1 n=1 Tax=Odontomachus brunneus TaxID=486640 RepID=UPI0013F21ECE|nr:m7GpppN-mRNA hydrolase isoform X1 [Odontomachus brunneus]XP_032685609.1 m7GpppN-mRNA hydrolase isoform X1 [Odontomachus brunneus]XP_032685610.1 m7GpppN-mRNA hydrolase isoform X1 [Odontomachus brunneus]